MRWPNVETSAEFESRANFISAAVSTNVSELFFGGAFHQRARRSRRRCRPAEIRPPYVVIRLAHRSWRRVIGKRYRLAESFPPGDKVGRVHCAVVVVVARYPWHSTEFKNNTCTAPRLVPTVWSVSAPTASSITPSPSKSPIAATALPKRSSFDKRRPAARRIARFSCCSLPYRWYSGIARAARRGRFHPCRRW